MTFFMLILVGGAIIFYAKWIDCKTEIYWESMAKKHTLIWNTNVGSCHLAYPIQAMGQLTKITSHPPEQANLRAKGRSDICLTIIL